MPGEATPRRSRAVIEQVVREEWGRVLATLVGSVRDLELAEDVLQDAVVAALEHWPRDGVPDAPGAWLLQTARRRAIDRFRRTARFAARREEIARLTALERLDPAAGGEEDWVDERLSLIFMCCHPSLGDDARVGLTLRALGGLTTREIARAFLVPETTMAQRLVRARAKIRAARVPYRVPPPELWPERLDAVLAVVYLIFNEGYAATSGPGPTRADLCQEAIRLAGILVELAPDEPEATGLLALMLLHDARRDARTGPGGELVTLERQDRSRWDRRRIDAGDRLLRRALGRRRPGPYQLQAAISAVHAGAASFAATDWAEIVALYDRLLALQPSWVVELNRAVALSFRDGAGAGLEALGRLEARVDPVELERYQPLWAVRADLLRRAGRRAEASAAYRRAAELTDNDAERRFLEERARQA